MKMSPFMLTAVALATSAVAMPAMAADNASTVTTVSTDAVNPADVQVVANWQAAEDQTSQLAVLRTALTGNAGRASALMTAGAELPNRAELLQDILTVLNENADANAEIISELVNQYADLIAANAGNVEPAGGDEGTDVSFAPDGGTPGSENPNQLNTPADTASPTSPIVP